MPAGSLWILATVIGVALLGGIGLFAMRRTDQARAEEGAQQRERRREATRELYEHPPEEDNAEQEGGEVERKA